MLKNLPKRPRLPSSEYSGFKKYFLTLKTFNNTKYFLFNKNVKFVEKLLIKFSKKYNFEIWLYLFMPDHLHLLIWAQKDGCNLENFVKNFKQITGYYFKKYTSHNLWSKSYYDHILRSEESVEGVVEYILQNPVRKNIVKNWFDYQFFGSTFFKKQDFY